MQTNSEIRPGAVVKIMHQGAARAVTVVRVAKDHDHLVFDYYLSPPNRDGRWAYVDEILEVITP